MGPAAPIARSRRRPTCCARPAIRRATSCCSKTLHRPAPSPRRATWPRRVTACRCSASAPPPARHGATRPVASAMPRWRRLRCARSRKRAMGHTRHCKATGSPPSACSNRARATVARRAARRRPGWIRAIGCCCRCCCWWRAHSAAAAHWACAWRSHCCPGRRLAPRMASTGGGARTSRRTPAWPRAPTPTGRAGSTRPCAPGTD